MNALEILEMAVWASICLFVLSGAKLLYAERKQALSARRLQRKRKVFVEGVTESTALTALFSLTSEQRSGASAQQASLTPQISVGISAMTEVLNKPDTDRIFPLGQIDRGQSVTYAGSV